MISSLRIWKDVVYIKIEEGYLEVAYTCFFRGSREEASVIL
jgi:hypothetical protein